MTNLTGIAGRWRIVSMELWDTDAIDLVEPGFIEFGPDRTGRFGFIAVQGWMDCREATRDGPACVEFTWEGSDEGDQVSGRGWAALADDGTLDGRISRPCLSGRSWTGETQRPVSSVACTSPGATGPFDRATSAASPLCSGTTTATPTRSDIRRQYLP